MGSIVSSLQFLSFKIDKISLESENTTGVLLKSYSPQDWRFSIGVRRPMYIVAERIYIGGIDITVISGDENKPEVRLHAGIAGIFKVIGDDIPPDREERVAKNQIPALLSPYLRAAVTSTLASAGFNSVIIPLFDFNRLAEEQLKDIQIERIEPNDISENSGTE